MEQLCFVTDFPGVEEKKFYRVLGNDASGNYIFFAGGTYVWVKNKKGLTVRFTSPEVKGGDISRAQMETWISRLHQLHANF